MIKLEHETLRNLQLIQLELLIEVDRICKKCHINYNIIAGTLLGAVRHKGFIPWDDDADVALLRGEYEKFRGACQTELDLTRFYFQDNMMTNGYRWGYGKLRRKNTAFVRENQEHMPYEQGVFIDVFPLDGVPDNTALRLLHHTQCYCVRKVLWSAVGRKSDKSFVKRGIYQLLYRIPSRYVMQYYHALIVRSNNKDTKMVRILTYPTPNNYFGYLRRWYEESADIVFENYVFKGIKDYDEYLYFKFGNYMVMPPKEERKAHPVSVIKLLESR